MQTHAYTLFKRQIILVAEPKRARQPHDSGILRDVNVKAITSLPSYRGHAVYAKVGSAVAPTKDLFGWGGAVKLANADAEQLVKDYAVIEALCHSGLWTIE